jgi:hypothetical protein
MGLFKSDKPEKYFFCENCGTLKTATEFYNDKIDRLAYGSPICNCEYGYLHYDEKSQSFIPVYGKTFIPYVEIPKSIYELLNMEHNEIIRMRMYNSWKKQINKPGD